MRRALCIGINDYPVKGQDLKGCVNDATAWADLLATKFDFAKSDIRVMTDAEATKANMVAALKELLKSASDGDVLAFTNASHGTYVVERGGDEEQYDEAICPYDAHEAVLRDDELRELLQNVPKNAHLTFISDSCFSGTVTRSMVMENDPLLADAEEVRNRFMSPAVRGAPILLDPWRATPKGKLPGADMTHVLLTGSSDSEYAYDAPFGGQHRGVMSYYAMQAIAKSTGPITYRQLHSAVLASVGKGRFPQTPQLEGPDHLKDRPIFS